MTGRRGGHEALALGMSFRQPGTGAVQVENLFAVFVPGPDGRPRTTSNHSGGIQGGMSNGEDILLRVAFKPTATISSPQQTVTRAGEAVTLEAKGRHDPCVLPRAVPIVEAAVLMVLADHWLRQAALEGAAPR